MIWKEHAEAAGRNPYYEAIKFDLYREAVERLRHVGFRGIKPNEVIADLLDQSAHDRFYDRSGRASFPDDTFEHLALMGAYYRDAVDQLRHGTIDGGETHEDIADAIDSWVKREFPKRLAEHKDR